MKRDYGRTTITVPWELKERMKKARAHVNWSAVACAAFEQKLTELGPIEEITSVEDAIKRMQSLDASPKEDVSKSGVEAGKHWAMNFAHPDQLKRIEGFRNQHSAEEWQELLSTRDGWVALARCIQPEPGAPRNRDAKIIPDPDERPRRHRRRRQGVDPGGPAPNREKEIWRSILGGRPDHPTFFLGFATGALEVWEQIKDQF